MKFTFKKVPRATGLASVGDTAAAQIKLDGKKVGYLRATPWHERNKSGWHITLAVKQEETENDPCDFRWVSLRWNGASEEEGRAFLNDKIDLIVKKYDLYRFED